MKRFRVSINNKTYEVEVEELGTGEKSQTTAPVKQTVPETTQKKTGSEAAREPAVQPDSADMEGEKITAPLPGNISLEVSEGDTVSRGDVLFVLEAMKMENEITSPVSGTVKSILVSEGATVDTGALLAIIT